MWENLKAAASLINNLKSPFEGSLYLSSEGIITRLSIHGVSYKEHVTSWAQMENAAAGINPLLFAISKLQRDLSQLHGK